MLRKNKVTILPKKIIINKQTHSISAFELLNNKRNLTIIQDDLIHKRTEIFLDTSFSSQKKEFLETLTSLNTKITHIKLLDNRTIYKNHYDKKKAYSILICSISLLFLFTLSQVIENKKELKKSLHQLLKTQHKQKQHFNSLSDKHYGYKTLHPILSSLSKHPLYIEKIQYKTPNLISITVLSLIDINSLTLDTYSLNIKKKKSFNTGGYYELNITL